MKREPYAARRTWRAVEAATGREGDHKQLGRPRHFNMRHWLLLFTSTAWLALAHAQAIPPAPEHGTSAHASPRSTGGAAVKAEPGGDGTISGFGVFSTGSKIIPEVGANYDIPWKMWALMGEPVGNYWLRWNVSFIRINTPQGLITLHMAPFTVPAELVTAARKAKLYIDGYSEVLSPANKGNEAPPKLRFNTGVAVAATGESSFDVPGSPSWDTMFVSSGDPCGKEPRYAGADTAKQIFKARFQLGSVVACRDSGITDVDALEDALTKSCQRMPKAARPYYCPPMAETEAADAVDKAFGAMEAQAGDKKLPRAPGAAASAVAGKSAVGSIDDKFDKMLLEREERDRQAYLARKAQEEADAEQHAHDQDVKVCKAIAKSQDSCVAELCGTRPAEQTCEEYSRGKDIGGAPKDAIPGQSYYVFPTYTCVRWAANPKYEEWRSCRTASVQQCAAGRTVQTVDECIAERTHDRKALKAAEPTLYDKAKASVRDAIKCPPQPDKPCKGPHEVATGRRG